MAVKLNPFSSDQISTLLMGDKGKEKLLVQKIQSIQILEAQFL